MKDIIIQNQSYIAGSPLQHGHLLQSKIKDLNIIGLIGSFRCKNSKVKDTEDYKPKLSREEHVRDGNQVHLILSVKIMYPRSLIQLATITTIVGTQHTSISQIFGVTLLIRTRSGNIVLHFLMVMQPVIFTTKK